MKNKLLIVLLIIAVIAIGVLLGLKYVLPKENEDIEGLLDKVDKSKDRLA